MVEKMHFVSFAGLIGSLDTFVVEQVIPREIQLINAYSILSSIEGVSKFDDSNPYQRLEDKVKHLGEIANVQFEYNESAPISMIPAYLLVPEIDAYEQQLETIHHISDNLKEDLEYKKQLQNQLLLIQDLDIKVDKLFDFDYVKFRFGVMTVEAFNKSKEFSNAIDVIMYEVYRTKKEIYLVYFTPRAEQKDIDAMFAAFHFKRIRLSDDIKGRPKDALKRLKAGIDELENRINVLEEQSQTYIQTKMRRIQELYTFVVQLDSVYDVRALAAKSEKVFYLVGWVADSQLEELEQEMKKINDVTHIIEPKNIAEMIKTPTKLKNPKSFKPFEALVEMYGVPSYNEWDPTIFVAIVYMILFGSMFGDVGQGLVVVLIGLLLYKKTGSTLGNMMMYLGGSSFVFGFVYGSLFGDEHLLGHLFNYNPIHPMDVIMQILVIAIVFGVLLLIIVMLINIKNAYKQHNIGKMLFERNGVAGLVFYLTILATIIGIIMNKDIQLWLILLLSIGSLIIIFLSHPLSNLVAGKKHIFPKEKGGFLIETSFELVETLLAFLSNTISFIRVGAFALNHAGFFLAFHMLSDIVAESSGEAGKIIVMILGNILIIALEGLIVGIQGMRLIYYELFSRFFEGEGEIFKPFSIKRS